MNKEKITFFSSNYPLKKLIEIESRPIKSTFREWDKAKRLANRVEALTVIKNLVGTNKRK